MKELFAPVVRLATHVGGRLDALSLDLARDAGAIVRDAHVLGDAVRGRATTLMRATPRVTRIVQVAAALLARQRWLALVNAARYGDPTLRAADHRDLARRAVAHAAELRGGIAKLGQLASCRPDLVGPIWATELAALQADVAPVAAAEIFATIEAELAAPIAELFAEIDEVPLAAASLAQVHAARLADGTRVVVKVQVPGIDDVIAADIAALRALASASTTSSPPAAAVAGMEIDLATIAAELSRTLAIELDYTAEAHELASYRGAAQVPAPIAQLSTRRVLTMTRVDGERLVPWLERATPAARDALLAELVGEVAAQILVRGQVHADPHPGNFLVTPAGGLAILDFGCVLELSAAERAAYARLMLAVVRDDRDGAARELVALGFGADDMAHVAELAASLVGALRPGANAASVDWQAAFAEQIELAKQIGALTIPRSFVLLGRVLVAVAGLLATYKPRIELHALVARQLALAVAG